MTRPLLYAILFACAMLASSVSRAADSKEFQNIQTLFKQGQYAQALERDNAWIAHHPKDAQARFLKGLILTEQNKTAEAISVFTALTEDFPELPEPYNNLAVLYASHGQYGRARNAVEMAIHTHPSYAIANENLGDIYAKMASIAYDKALKLDTKNNTVHTKLALIKEIFAEHPLASDCTGSSTAATAKGSSSVIASPAATANGKPAADTPMTPPAASPAAAAATTPVSAPSAADEAAITQALQTWAQAWSHQNADAYLAAYAPQFKTPDNLSRPQWEALRRARISKPKHISVQLSDLHIVQSDTDHATAGFTETYHSNLIDSVGHKTLNLTRVHGNWLIVQELSR